MIYRGYSERHRFATEESGDMSEERSIFNVTFQSFYLKDHIPVQPMVFVWGNIYPKLIDFVHFKTHLLKFFVWSGVMYDHTTTIRDPTPARIHNFIGTWAAFISKLIYNQRINLAGQGFGWLYEVVPVVVHSIFKIPPRIYHITGTWYSGQGKPAPIHCMECKGILCLRGDPRSLDQTPEIYYLNACILSSPAALSPKFNQVVEKQINLLCMTHHTLPIPFV